LENKVLYVKNILTDLIETYTFDNNILSETGFSDPYPIALFEANILLDLIEENDNLSPIEIYLLHQILENEISRINIQLDDNVIQLLENRIIEKPLIPIKKLASVLGEIKRKFKRGAARRFGHKLGNLGSKIENKKLIGRLGRYLKKYGIAHDLIKREDFLKSDIRDLEKGINFAMKHYPSYIDRKQMKSPYITMTLAQLSNKRRNEKYITDLERKLRELGF
jgi:AraC-like DNA-binding protein